MTQDQDRLIRIRLSHDMLDIGELLYTRELAILVIYVRYYGDRKISYIIPIAADLVAAVVKNQRLTVQKFFPPPPLKNDELCSDHFVHDFLSSQTGQIRSQKPITSNTKFQHHAERKPFFATFSNQMLFFISNMFKVFFCRLCCINFALLTATLWKSRSRSSLWSIPVATPCAIR
jgi:hypothetical protein